MGTDPRGMVKTDRIELVQEWGSEYFHIQSLVSDGCAGGDWPELVAFAKAILAADEAWQDSQLGEPLPLEDLQAAHPELLLAIHPLIDGAFRATWESARDGWTEDFKTEKAALRWLAAELAKHGEEMGNG